MSAKLSARSISLALVLLFAYSSTATQGQNSQSLSGTLVVAVPVNDGVVVCSDKRVYNRDAGTFADNFVKIRKVSDNALFAATNTFGFWDPKRHKLAFDAFEITTGYAAKNNFVDGPQFWNGLKKEISGRLREYLAKREFAEWPESDKENNDLLFNLVFYSVADDRVRSHTLKVFYEKAATPVIYVADPVREEVKTPKLSGKGTELLNYLARNPELARDPAILRFDSARFDQDLTTKTDAVSFAKTLFRITNTALPQARVSSTFDCASLNSQNGFQWVNESGSMIDR